MGKMKRKMPPGMGGGKAKGGKNDMMKQLQKMQEEMQQAQEALEEATVEGTAGGGAVKVVATGSKTVTAVTIDPDVIDEDDVEMLEDLIVAAVNDAMAKADEMTGAQYSKFTGGMGGMGMNIPGLG